MYIIIVYYYYLDNTCSMPGSLQLSGGESESEGVLDYCSNGYWVQFCSLDEEEAIVACKQLGYQPFASKSKDICHIFTFF